jgi:hypothetical protein
MVIIIIIIIIIIAAAFWPLRGHDRLREPAALVRGKVLDFPERARASTRTFPSALAGAGQADLARRGQAGKPPGHAVASRSAR